MFAETSPWLLAVTADFLDAGAADVAIRAVTGERRKAVQQAQEAVCVL